MSVTDATDPSAPPGRLTGSGAAAVSASASSSPMPGSAGSSVDTDNPWLGLASFTEESQAYFFGREGEVAELTRRVQRKLLTVLFGKSGLGKTSILRAGLVPRLRAQGHFPVYLRIDYGHDSPEPGEQIKQAINRAARDLGTAGGTGNEAGGHWTESGVAVPGESIWEFLHHRDDVLKDASGHTLVPLLIFDQFEELFTLAQSDEFGRARAAKFVEELSDLVENRPPKALEATLDTDESIAGRFDFGRSDYRVVIALREDYLAPLESLKKRMPSLSQNRLRLAPMTGTQALEAVLQPGNRLRPGKPLVSEEVAEAIVRFVAGGSELANAEVEPSLLSLICRELNEQRIAQGRSEISQDLLAGSHETILSTFYERSLADQPESVRRIIEDDLLTESGYRENLAEESLLRRFQTAGAAPDALGKLVNRRLLRIEERLDVRRVELTHDVLTGIVRTSRDACHEREAREATERALAEQHAREEAAHRALRRTRAIAAGCGVLALVAIAAALFALVSFNRARHAELMVRQARAVSEQARGEAERLLGFLTDDFVSELTTFGRYQTIVELSQRETDYFQHLPPQLKDPETVRSDAVARVDRAEAIGLLGDVSVSEKISTQAVSLLETLRRTDKSDATAVALGRAYQVQGTGFVGVPDFTRARIDLQRAADLLRPVAERAGASTEARTEYLEALMFLGIPPLQGVASVVNVEREALRVGQALGAPDHADVTVEAYYAYAGAALTDALSRLDRDTEALQAGEDALAAANRALAQRPQFGMALIAKLSAESTLIEVTRNELDPSEALLFATQEAQTARALVRVEPKNGFYARSLGVADADAGDSLWAIGRFRDAIASGGKAIKELGYAAASGEGVGPIDVAFETLDTATREAGLGDAAGATATIASAEPYLSPATLGKLGFKGRPMEVYIRIVRADAAATVAYERNDFGAARRIERNALAQLEATKADGPVDVLLTNDLLADLPYLEGQTDYALGDFAAAETAEHTALKAANVAANKSVAHQRSTAQLAIWLSMALAREGKREEAAQTIAPVVTMYRGLEKRNHGDQWLPLEFAEALYAQSLTDPSHRAALLHEASGLVDHLTPSIAKLHDTREWRARIEAAQRQAGG